MSDPSAATQTTTAEPAAPAEVNETAAPDAAVEDVTQAPSPGEQTAAGDEAQSAPESTEADKEAAAKAAAKADLEARAARREARAKKRAEAKQAEAERIKNLEKREADLAAYEKAKNAKDPIEALRNLGYSDDQIVDVLAEKAGEEEPDNGTKALAELEKLKAEQAAKVEAERKEREEADLAARKERVSKGRAAVVEAIKEEAEKYQYLNATGNQETVVDVAEEYYRQHQQTLNLETAAGKSEEYFENLIKAVAGTAKFQAQFKAIEAAEAAPGEAPPAKAKTLTVEGGGGDVATDGLPNDWRARADALIGTGN